MDIAEGNVCVFPSKMACAVFCRRKITHRTNIICCIMYPILNIIYIILRNPHGYDIIKGIFSS